MREICIALLLAHTTPPPSRLTMTQGMSTSMTSGMCAGIGGRLVSMLPLMQQCLSYTSYPSVGLHTDIARP